MEDSHRSPTVVVVVFIVICIWAAEYLGCSGGFCFGTEVCLREMFSDVVFQSFFCGASDLLRWDL